MLREKMMHVLGLIVRFALNKRKIRNTRGNTLVSTKLTGTFNPGIKKDDTSEHQWPNLRSYHIIFEIKPPAWDTGYHHSIGCSKLNTEKRKKGRGNFSPGRLVMTRE